MKGGTNKRTNEWTDGRTNESPPVFYRTSSPSGPLPKRQPLLVRQRRGESVEEAVLVATVAKVGSIAE